MRSRTTLTVLSLAVLVALAVWGTTALAQGGGSSGEELERRIQALESRLATLERTLQQRLSSLEQRVQSNAAAPDPKEAEAQQAYAEISRLVAQNEYEKAQQEMAEFMKAYGSTAMAQKARGLHAELSVIGKPAPESWGIEKWFQGQDKIDLASNKTTLVVFFEEWCPHCKREIPKLQQVYSNLKDEGLQVVAFTRITKSATEEKVTALLAQDKVEYPVAKEDGSLSSAFGVSGIPAAAVLKDGKVVWRGHPGRLTEAQLKAWL